MESTEQDNKCRKAGIQDLFERYEDSSVRHRKITEDVDLLVKDTMTRVFSYLDSLDSRIDSLEDTSKRTCRQFREFYEYLNKINTHLRMIDKRFDNIGKKKKKKKKKGEKK